MKKVIMLAAMLLAVTPFTVSAQTDQSTETKTPAKKKTSAQTKSSEKSTPTAKGKQPLKLVTTTPLPGFTGDFDHFGLDLNGKRLFLTAEDHKTVEVFDLDGKHLHSITGFATPHAALYVPESDKLIVADGDDDFGKAEIVDGKTYKIVNTLKLPNGADGAVYNPNNHTYYIETGSDAEGVKTHAISKIDTQKLEHTGDLTFPGNHSEGMAIDHEGKKLYVNLTGENKVGVVDLASGKVENTWPVPGAKKTNAMILDEANHRLFITARTPPKLIILNSDNGSLVASFPISDLNDDAWYDAAHKRIYATGTGTTTVFEQKDADHYEKIADVPTGFRAKTSILVPELNRLYIAVSGKGKAGAKLALQVYDIQ
jgi:DNA-binding beta-propeller fold protein YncE